MPLLRVSQTHTCLNQPPRCLYEFAEEHRKGWCSFWKALDGDLDKILDFAKKAEVANPEEWYSELHRFLFDVFSGDYRLLKKAAKADFGGFISQIAENHVNDPKEDNWYFLKGLTYNKFLAMLEYAANIPVPHDAIANINSHVPGFGAKLYSEFLLSKTKHKSEIKSIASEINKKAYDLEKGLTGKTFFDNIPNKEFKVKYAGCPNEILNVVAVDKENEFIIVEDSDKNEGFIFGVWDVEII